MEDVRMEIGSNLFYGFYESIFSNSDEFIDWEYEDKDMLIDLLCCSKIDIEVEYVYQNYDEYKIDVCNAFMEYYIEKIHEELPYDITDHKDFKLEKIGDITVISPKYYNYTTDKCYCDIITNYKTLKLIKEYTLGLNGVKEYLFDHFTSCDGFISFISNDIEYWKELDIKDYEENMIIALLDMLIILSDSNNAFELNESTYYDIDKFAYAIPYCYYKGKQYTVYELVNNTIKYIKSKYPIALKFDICPY